MVLICQHRLVSFPSLSMGSISKINVGFQQETLSLSARGFSVIFCLMRLDAHRLILRLCLGIISPNLLHKWRKFLAATSILTSSSKEGSWPRPRKTAKTGPELCQKISPASQLQHLPRYHALSDLLRSVHLQPHHQMNGVLDRCSLPSSSSSSPGPSWRPGGGEVCGHGARPRGRLARRAELRRRRDQGDLLIKAQSLELARLTPPPLSSPRSRRSGSLWRATTSSARWASPPRTWPRRWSCTTTTRTGRWPTSSTAPPELPSLGLRRSCTRLLARTGCTSLCSGFLWGPLGSVGSLWGVGVGLQRAGLAEEAGRRRRRPRASAHSCIKVPPLFDYLARVANRCVFSTPPGVENYSDLNGLRCLTTEPSFRLPPGDNEIRLLSLSL